MLHQKITATYKNLIEKHLNDDVTKLVLAGNKNLDVDFQFFTQQLGLLQKARFKLPTFFNERCIFTTRAFEQCTSEVVAQFKSELFHGHLLLDLTGGLGIDDWAFSKSFSHIISVDADAELNEIAKYNNQLLGIQHIERVTDKGEAFLNLIDHADLIYIDPDRRADGSRHVAISKLEPNILALMPQMLAIAKTVAIKLSPLFDILEIKKIFGQVAEIYTIAEHNEVKEVLVVIDKQAAAIKEFAINLTTTHLQQFEKTASLAPTLFDARDHYNYFYEPNHALIKSGLWPQYIASVQGNILHQLCPFMVSQHLIELFHGRTFQLVNMMPYKIKALVKYFKDLGISKAHINRREFPDTVDLIRKKLGLADGGDDYLFFTKTFAGDYVCVHARKL
jgi:16S rRNA G966 N2-methylase RsmD